MDKITAKIRNYRSVVKYATYEEAVAAMKKKIARDEARGYFREYQVLGWLGAFSFGGKAADGIVYYTVERKRR